MRFIVRTRLETPFAREDTQQFPPRSEGSVGATSRFSSRLELVVGSHGCQYFVHRVRGFCPQKRQSPAPQRRQQPFNVTTSFQAPAERGGGVQGLEFLARYYCTKATVASLLSSLPLAKCKNSPDLSLPPMLQFYGAGTFRGTVTGDLVNVPRPTVFRVVEQVPWLIASALCHRLANFPGSTADLDFVM